MRFWKSIRSIERERIRQAQEGLEALGIGTNKPTAEKPRIERVYVRYEGEGDDLKEIMCPKDEAEATHFIYTAFHPIDGHEYGLILSLTEVVDEIPEHLHNEGVGALERYMTEHPDGKDKNDE